MFAAPWSVSPTATAFKRTFFRTVEYQERAHALDQVPMGSDQSDVPPSI